MSVKLLTEHYLEFLSLKGGCTGSSESTLVKMPHCWKSHVTAQLCKTVENHTQLAAASVNDFQTVIFAISVVTMNEYTYEFFITILMMFKSRETGR